MVKNAEIPTDLGFSVKRHLRHLHKENSLLLEVMEYEMK